MGELKFLDSVITVVNQQFHEYSVFCSVQPYHDDPREYWADIYEFRRNYPPNERGQGNFSVEISGLENLSAIARRPLNIHNAVIKFALRAVKQSLNNEKLVFDWQEYNKQSMRKQIDGQELRREILHFIYWVNQKHPEKGIAWPILADNLDASNGDINEMLRTLTKAGLLERQPQFESFRIARGHESLEPFIINPQKEAEVKQVIGLGTSITQGGRHRYFNPTEIAIPLQNGFVFVLMPFNDNEFPQIFYGNIAEPIVKETLGLPCDRADKGQNNFGESKIFTGIKEARIIIADLSTENKNVIFEFGMALALGKPVIPLFDKRKKSEGKALAFDYEHFQTVFYDDFDDLRAKLKERLGAFRNL